jgi:hypothetical protein
MCRTTTQVSQIKENDIKISMPQNTTVSPFTATPCFHAIESKHHQQPIGKKNPSLKTLKPLSVHTQNPKVRSLLRNLNVTI